MSRVAISILLAVVACVAVTQAAPVIQAEAEGIWHVVASGLLTTGWAVVVVQGCRRTHARQPTPARPLARPSRSPLHLTNTCFPLVRRAVRGL